MAFELIELPYNYDALAPYMSRETLEYHHDKHYLTYLINANNFIKDLKLEEKCLEDLVVESFNTHVGLFNNISQYYNHTHFWKWMKKDGGGSKIPEKLMKSLESSFGSYDKFRADFIVAGTSQFGSGWAWLAVQDGELKIMKTPNGENPLIHGAQPILGVDVWEHSYYIDYRNARPKYLEAFVDHLINWDYVLELYENCKF
ncbi:superoxide dismutase [Bartonella ancashensis]|uniref:Superoxide dismutase n=1 Tax=Bartonella ancashensis TaxID=1318743 RepID=A0A0M4M6Z6_9HYPH|nr:superoxide dismutase [Bartonella ancashensis]ALE04042.1 Superoxide dismutase (Fe) [Bartonella ancashensis]